MQQAIMPQGHLPRPAYATLLSIECLLRVRQEPVLCRSTLDGIRGTAPRTPQYTAGSYTVLLNFAMVSIERFLCRHSDSKKQVFFAFFFSNTKKYNIILLNSNTC